MTHLALLECTVTSGIAVTACSSALNPLFCFKKKSPKLRDIRSVIEHFSTFTSYRGTACSPSLAAEGTCWTLAAENSHSPFAGVKVKDIVNMPRTCRLLPRHELVPQGRSACDLGTEPRR